MTLRQKLTLGTVGIGVVMIGVAWAQVERQLLLNGAVVSKDIRVIDGRAYVPVKDVASALKMDLAVQGNLYTLTRKGGANQLEGLNGKIGDWVFDGGWRLRVDSVAKMDVYQRVNEYYDDPEYRADEGKELVVIRYSYRNGNKEIMNINFAAPLLAGADGTAIPAFHNDFPHDGDRWFAKALLPGAEGKGAWLFMVPPGFEFKDVVVKMGDFAGYDESTKPKQPSVFRFSLITSP